METNQNFRSALNGFNREDVVSYISLLSNRHETQINALRTEADELRQEIHSWEQTSWDLKQRLEDMEKLNAELEEQLDRQEQQHGDAEADRAALEQLQAELGEKIARISMLEQTADRQAKEIARLNQELSTACQKSAQPDYSAELNAYRRAESAERRAMERVNQMCDQANGVMAEASVRVQQSAQEITALAANVQAELEKLQQALGNSGTVFADTAAMLGAIRPELD